jgi:hypothetical protein
MGSIVAQQQMHDALSKLISGCTLTASIRRTNKRSRLREVSSSSNDGVRLTERALDSVRLLLVSSGLMS